MTAVTVAELCRTLPDDLRPVHPPVPPAAAISAVHVSELLDPVVYLDGGELLLTTGLALPRRAEECRRYVDRLVRGGVAALAFGVGPVHPAIPPRLVDACRQAGLGLLEVPEPTPFLTISRAFWSAVSRADRHELSAALSAYQQLARAATGPRPVPGLLRALAETVSGWAALLDPLGTAVDVWPDDRLSTARRLAAETARLRMAGMRAAATFPVDGDDVVVHPLADGARVVGYLATGAPPVAADASPGQHRSARSTISGAHRHVVLMAAALLSLDAVRSRRATAAVRAARASIAQLIDLGQAEAARRLGQRLGIDVPDGLARLVVFDGVPADTGLDVIAAACRGTVLGVSDDPPPDRTQEREVTWCVVAADGLAWPELQRSLSSLGSDVRCVVGAPLELDDLASMRTRLAAELSRRPVPWIGEAGGDGLVDAGGAHRLVAPLVELDRPKVVAAVAAYLRQRGHWEAAARELGLHRNTVRYRVGTAERLLGVDLRDPDAAATVWLSLRALGLA